MGIPERWRRFRELPVDIEHRLADLTPLFERDNVRLVYLFGSLTQDRPAHDVDLAILTQGEPAYRLYQAIADCLGTERLDLVDLRRAPPVLRFQIVRAGRPIYVADEREHEQFVLDTLHLYRDTAPLRRQQRELLRKRIAKWSSIVKQSSNG